MWILSIEMRCTPGGGGVSEGMWKSSRSSPMRVGLDARHVMLAREASSIFLLGSTRCVHPCAWQHFAKKQRQRVVENESHHAIVSLVFLERNFDLNVVVPQTRV